MRAPDDRFVKLTKENRRECTLHWFPLVAGESTTMHSVGPLSTLAHIIRCQPEHLAIAAIDNALHERIVQPEQLSAVFASLPRKYRHYLQRVDARAMSGIETIARLLLLDSGLSCVPQVHIRGVGIVDLLVEGAIVIETDGRAWHSGMTSVARDYDRDAILAALKLIVLRFNYRQVMFTPDVVIAAVRGALASRNH